MKYTILLDDDNFAGIVSCDSIILNKKNKRVDIFSTGLIHHFTYNDNKDVTVEDWVRDLKEKGVAEGFAINLKPLINCQCQ